MVLRYKIFLIHFAVFNINFKKKYLQLVAKLLYIHFVFVDSIKFPIIKNTHIKNLP